MKRVVKVATNRTLNKLGYQLTRTPNTTKPAPSESSVKQTLEAVDPKKVIAAQTRQFGVEFNRYLQNHDTVKLHFGCGPRVLKDWVNIDLAFEPYEAYLKYYKDTHYPENVRGTKKDFYAFDPTKKPLPIPDNTVDVIFHEDFFEHISQRDQVAFLAETLRVLKKGGIHRVNTPDLLSSMKLHSDFSKGFNGVSFGEWDNHQNLSVITNVVLEELTLMVGYSRVVFNHKGGSSSKLLPKEYRPDPNDRPENGNVFADLIK